MRGGGGGDEKDSLCPDRVKSCVRSVFFRFFFTTCMKNCLAVTLTYSDSYSVKFVYKSKTGLSTADTVESRFLDYRLTLSNLGGGESA